MSANHAIDPVRAAEYDAPESKAAGGMLMALTLILLTLVVYLFSLSLPDESRRRAVHASLAKAFYFPGADEDLDQGPQGPVLLLDPGRDALRALEAHLEGHPGAGVLRWEQSDFVIALPTPRVFPGGIAVPADPAGTLREISRLLARTKSGVRVEAPTLTAAVALTHALLGSGEGLSVAHARVSAAGTGTGADPVAPDGGRELRVVLQRARGTL
jgi:hypothetical protein